MATSSRFQEDNSATSVMPLKINRLILVGIFFVLAVLESKSQDLLLRTFNTNDGLSSSECYRLIQDKQGFIWIGTNNGLVKYDGSSFNVLTTAHGLPQNEIIDLVESPNGGIYAISLANKITKIEGDSVRILPINIGDKKHFRNNPNGFAETKDGRYILYNKRSEKMLILNQDFSPVDSNFSVTPNEGDYLIRLFPGQKSVQVSPRKISPSSKPTFILNKNEIIVSGLDRKDYSFHNLGSGSVMGISPNGHFVFWDGKTVTQGQFLYKHIIKAKKDRDGNTWVLTSNGAHFYRSSDFGTDELFFDGQFITDVIQDQEGNTWLTDHNMGLHKIQSTGIRRFNTADLINKSISTLKVRQNFLWISTIDGDIYRLSQQRKTEKIHQDFRGSYDYYPFEVFDKHLFLPGAVLSKPGGFIKNTEPARAYRAYKNIQKTSKGVFVAMSQGVGLFDSLGKQVYSSEHPTQANNLTLQLPDFSSRSNALYENDEGIWIGSADGLHLYDGTSFIHLGKKQELLSARVLDICKLEENKLALATKGSGVVIYDTKSGDVAALGQGEGLLSSTISDVLYTRNQLFIATNKGLTIMRYSGSRFEHIQNYALLSDISSNEIFALAEFNDKIWIATKKGLMYLDPSSIKSQKPSIPVFLTGLTDGLIPIRWKNNVAQVSAKQRNLVFKFADISFADNAESSFRYVLLNADKDTGYTSVREARYTNLAPGNYEFLVWAKPLGGTWTKQPAHLSIHIPKFYYETNSFRIGILALCILIMLGIFRSILKRRRAIDQQKITTLELQQKALAALMNPHFINNSLSAIQLFVNRRDLRKSNDFISGFARLIRQNLNSIRQGSVSLEDEIGNLKIYLDIEQMRVGEKLRYNIECLEEDITGIYIPSMIIQPFVENAIWHGVLPLERAGEVNITFELQANDTLKVLVVDNGVGIEERGSGHPNDKSMGIKLIRERLQLLQKDKKIDPIIIRPNSAGSGTIVEIRLPVEFKFDR